MIAASRNSEWNTKRSTVSFANLMVSHIICWFEVRREIWSVDNEKRILKKCRELNAEIVANAAKVQTALKLSEEDQSTIASLKKELEKAWKLVDSSHEKAPPLIPVLAIPHHF